jgi:hypothetical protein
LATSSPTPLSSVTGVDNVTNDSVAILFFLEFQPQAGAEIDGSQQRLENFF